MRSNLPMAIQVNFSHNLNLVYPMVILLESIGNRFCSKQTFFLYDWRCLLHLSPLYIFPPVTFSWFPFYSHVTKMASVPGVICLHQQKLYTSEVVASQWCSSSKKPGYSKRADPFLLTCLFWLGKSCLPATSKGKAQAGRACRPVPAGKPSPHKMP